MDERQSECIQRGKAPSLEETRQGRTKGQSEYDDYLNKDVLMDNL